jgi:hypothetical protein
MPGTFACPCSACPWAASVAPPRAADWLCAWPEVWLTALSRTPLFTNPVTPCAASGLSYWCALTDRFGIESPPMVDKTPPAYLVTTSTCPSNSTQSPGWGV